MRARVSRRGAADLGKVLLGGAHLQQRAVVQFQRIAVVQNDGPRQIQEEGLPRIVLELDAAAEAVVEGERDGSRHIGCGQRPAV